MDYRVLYGRGLLRREQRLESFDTAARCAIELMQAGRMNVRVVLPGGTAIRMGTPPPRRPLWDSTAARLRRSSLG
jgi:hypothetical protein